MIAFNTEKIPKIKEIIRVDDSDKDIVVVEFKYCSVNSNEIYTVFAYPKKDGVYPCLTVFHGGTQNAQIVKNRVIQNAKDGYISLAPELPVIAEPTRFSVGGWTKKGYMSGAFENTDNPLFCSLYETITAACESFLLAENIDCMLPENIKFQKNRIGLTGFSWGGYTVTMLLGIFGKRVTVGFSNYGCGYYDLSYFWSKYFEKMSEKNKEIWLENFDAGRRAKNIVSPYFIASPSNDLFFNPPSVMKTLETISSKSKGLVFSPNSHHCIEVPGGTSKNPDDPHGCAMEKVYFDYWLKNEGERFFTVERKNSEIKISKNVMEVKVYFSKNDKKWTERNWQLLDNKYISFDGEKYTLSIPEELKQNCDFYFLATDEQNVSVSSDIFNLK